MYVCYITCLQMTCQACMTIVAGKASVQNRLLCTLYFHLYALVRPRLKYEDDSMYLERLEKTIFKIYLSAGCSLPIAVQQVSLGSLTYATHRCNAHLATGHPFALTLFLSQGKQRTWWHKCSRRRPAACTSSTHNTSFTGSSPVQQLWWTSWHAARSCCSS